jgi:hypothetical protein
MAIDQEAGLIRVTTALAHSSGKCLSSEWPVCSVAELTAEHGGKRVKGLFNSSQNYFVRENSRLVPTNRPSSNATPSTVRPVFFGSSSTD